MAAAKRNRKGQFVKRAKRKKTRARARRPPQGLARYRAALAGLFRRKVKPKGRRAPNPPKRRPLTGSERRATGQRSTGDRLLMLASRHAALSKAADRRLHRKRHSPKTAASHAGRQAAADRVYRLYADLSAPKRRKATKPRKRKSTMSRALARNSKGHFVKRGRRTVTVKVANPKRKHHRRRATNPRRKHHARRAHNPMGGGLMKTAKASLMPMALGGLAGATAGYVDAKWLGKQATVSILFKVIAAIAGAAMIGKRHPLAAAGWSGGLIGATGYYAGVKMGGGLVALNKAGALAGLADMAADDPDLAAQIAGLGDVVDEMGDDAALGDAANDYNEALGDAEDMADVVDE